VIVTCGERDENREQTSHGRSIACELCHAIGACPRNRRQSPG
jgi:hypothetical protein